MDYAEFIAGKGQSANLAGFEPLWLPDFLMPFQRHLTDWAIRRGRGALYEGCGLGKTPQSLVYAQNVVMKTNRPVLILTNLSVAGQFVREGEKFGIECRKVKNGQFGPGINVTNYEQLEHYNAADFAGAVGDESSAIKDSDSKTKAIVTEFFRTLDYRLLATATPAPNDYDELGTSSEALGELGYQDMLTRFFKKDQKGGQYRWGIQKLRLKGHAEEPFWRWVCSWSRACEKPSDLGFEDGAFLLPSLTINEHEVKANRPPAGMMFDLGANTLQEQKEEQRRTIEERCEKVAELVKGHDRSICWVNLNDEGDLTEKLIPGSRQVSGSTDEEERDEIIAWFTAADSDCRVLVTKPKVFGYGLNLQRCAHQTFFVSHSFEQWYQAVRRCWRFGQTRPVTVDVVTTDGACNVLANLRRKQEAADKMFARMAALIGRFQAVERTAYGSKAEEIPSWLSSIKS